MQNEILYNGVRKRGECLKVIFLDVDGVLNCFETFKRVKEEFEKTGKRSLEIDERMVERLARIVKETGAEVVLSSSWRAYWRENSEGIYPDNDKSKGLTEVLLKHGVKLHSKTTTDRKRYRQNEILSWLEGRSDVTKFVILDDESFDLPRFLNKELIKTSVVEGKDMLMDARQQTGLQDCHVEKAIGILNSKR